MLSIRCICHLKKSVSVARPILGSGYHYADEVMGWSSVTVTVTRSRMIYSDTRVHRKARPSPSASGLLRRP